jgi:hypothetical protein
VADIEPPTGKPWNRPEEKARASSQKATQTHPEAVVQISLLLKLTENASAPVRKDRGLGMSIASARES